MAVEVHPAFAAVAFIVDVHGAFTPAAAVAASAEEVGSEGGGAAVAARDCDGEHGTEAANAAAHAAIAADAAGDTA